VILHGFRCSGVARGLSLAVRRDSLQDSVYVLGIGDRALRLSRVLRERAISGMRVVSWTGRDGRPDQPGYLGCASARRRAAAEDPSLIVALADSRGNLPVKELLHLRLQGVKD